LWQRLVATWAEFQRSMRAIGAEKDWKHVSMQKMATLNTCCDVACHSSCHTSQPVLFGVTDDNHNWLSSEPPTFERTQQTFSQMKKFRSSQVSVVTFSGGVGMRITVCFFVR